MLTLVCSALIVEVLGILTKFSDLLTRLRLHTCAAYLRKFCEMKDVRNKTLVRIIQIFIPQT